MDRYVYELILEKGESFIKIIPNIQSYSQILEIKTFFQSLFERVVEMNCCNVSDLDKLFNFEKIIFEALKSKTLKEKIIENLDIIKRRMIEKYISMSEYYLVDFNWNVNVFNYT